ncbi:MAG: class I SAM-dependent methyltransferase, partial [Methanobacterium sp.]|nr:class I SAM-dependent methyltransferase [Methanobacterium sp.]
MNRLWNNVIKPIIERIDAKYIVEVGSDTGLNTKNILEYCLKHDARMTAIDPFPKFDAGEFKARYGNKFEIYLELSLSRLPLLNDYDVILIDGDHNWYTVYNELKIIEKNFKNKKFPLVFLHDVGWPYARRDLYYNPENIPEIYRQPYKKLGMHLDQTDLKKTGGLNTHLYNSIYENNPQNGVLTAIEDFVEESDLNFSFKIINIFHGLGILFPKNEEIENVTKKIINNTDLLSIVEEERVKQSINYFESEIAHNKTKKTLENLYETQKTMKYELESSKELIQQKELHINSMADKLNQTENELKSSQELIQQKELHINSMADKLN